jgi:hypothetical protein
MMIKHLKQERGISALIAIGTMMLASVLGLALSSLMSTSQTIRYDHVEQDQANFVNTAGIEYAMKRIYDAKDIDAGDIDFGAGTFRVSQSGSLLTVTSVVGAAQVSHQVSLPNMAGCLDIDTSEVHTHYDGSYISRIYLVKKCGDAVILDKMNLSWEPDNEESYDKARLSSSSHRRIYDGPPRVRSGQEIDIIDTTMRYNKKHKLKDIRFVDRSHEPKLEPDMRLKDSYRLNLIFSDGSEKEVSFTMAACPHNSC